MALADEMPLTADYVAQRRKAWGNDHVSDMVKRAMKGERNCFWAVEMVTEAKGANTGQYRTVGAPFDAAADDSKLASLAMMYGQTFMGMMRPPP